MQRSVAVGVLALVLASAVLAGPTGATTTERPAFAQPQGFDETTFDITVYENASARWTIEHRKALENDSQVSQFRDFAREFETERSDLYASFVNRTYALTAAGTNATGRNMTAIAHSRSASVEHITQPQGVVRLSFTWTSFGVTNGKRVTIGDVFEGGIPIGANQRLVVHPAQNLAIASATPDDYVMSGDTLATSDSITWFGERRFADGHPQVEFLPPSAIGDGTQGTNPGTTQGGDAPNDQGSNPVMFAGLLLIVAVLAAGLAYQRGVFERLPTGDGDDGTAGSESSDGTDGPAAPPEPEVVSDRDRVKELLSDNGGRMKQVRIVDETDWSKSKVSMLLSEMEEDGEISKLRVGRENIVSLSGHEPDAAGSPFDEE